MNSGTFPRADPHAVLVIVRVMQAQNADAGQTLSYREFFKRMMTIVVAILVILILWYLRSIWLRAFLAVILAVAISIPAGWLQRRGLRRGWSYAISIFGIGAVLTLLSIWTLPTIVRQTGNLILGLPEVYREAVSGYDAWRESSETLTTVLPPSDANFDELAEALQAIGITTTDVVSFGYSLISTGLSALPVLEGVGAILTVVANLAIVGFIALFLLVEPRTYIKASLLLLPGNYHQRMLEIWQRLYHSLTTWITAQLLSVTITSVLVWLILGVVLGMPFSLIVAVIAGFATFIPNVGVFIPIIPIIIFTLSDDPGQLIIVVPTYLFIQLFESNFITPSVVKAELDIPSGAVLLFQVIAAFLFGAGGILLAVPLLVVLLTLIREIYSYDVLRLRDVDVEIVGGEGGRLALAREVVAEPGKEADADPLFEERPAAEEGPLAPEGGG